MFTFTLTPDVGDAIELKADSRDIYMWERTGQNRTLKTLLENLAISDLYAVAHIAARRHQLDAGTLEDFVQRYALDFEEDAEPDPTQPAPSTGG